MNYVFAPTPINALPIFGSTQTFPVRRVYCVGRNYAAHAREMGSDPTREPPFFFCKPGDGRSVFAVPHGQLAQLPYPSATTDYHYELELVVAIGKAGKDIATSVACEHIYGYALGLDMTRRDLQGQLRQAGRPWEAGKAFDFSAPIGPIYPAKHTEPLHAGAITLSVNGAIKQQSDISQLIWGIPEIISRLSVLFELGAGDLIFTGTPEGVGAVVPGDRMHAAIAGLGQIELIVV